MTKRFERIHRSRIRLTERDFKTVVAVCEARTARKALEAAIESLASVKVVPYDETL